MPRCRARAAASDALLGGVVREEAGRIVATLTRAFGSLDVAEEAVAEAVEEALRAWRERGIPPRPGAWLTQAARHNALDRAAARAAVPGADAPARRARSGPRGARAR